MITGPVEVDMPGVLEVRLGDLDAEVLEDRQLAFDERKPTSVGRPALPPRGGPMIRGIGCPLLSRQP